MATGSTKVRPRLDSSRNPSVRLIVCARGAVRAAAESEMLTEPIPLERVFWRQNVAKLPGAAFPAVRPPRRC